MTHIPGEPKNDPVAQRLERDAHNVTVAGSSPAGITTAPGDLAMLMLNEYERITEYGNMGSSLEGMQASLTALRATYNVTITRKGE